MKDFTNSNIPLTRRQFTTGLLTGLSLSSVSPFLAAKEKPEKFKLNYILSSAMYGYEKLDVVLDQVKKTGANSIDLWPKVHGNQREQADALGPEKFKEELEKRKISLGGIACYRKGPFNLDSEMQFASKVSSKPVILVCTARGPKNVKGKELKSAIKTFIRQMEPHIKKAEKSNCIIAIENHSGSMIKSPDSIRWLGELSPSSIFGLALAPHHLPQDGKLIGGLAEHVGSKVKFFYAQQHGMGSSKKLPKEQELLQMPGRGKLDFAEILKGLKKAKYKGPTEIFMHPVPRGVPILETPQKITEEILKSRKYLEDCLKKLP